MTARLRSTYRRRPDATAESSWFGTFDLEVVDDTRSDLPAGTRLAVWSAMLLEPTTPSAVRVVERLAGHVVLEPLDAVRLPWRIDGLRSRFPARHANDGPEAAWLILPDDTTVELTVVAAVALDLPRPRAASTAPSRAPSTTSQVAVVPHPTRVTADRQPALRRPLRIAVRAGRWSHVGRSVVELERRLGGDVLASEPIDGHVSATLAVDDTLATEAYRLTVDATEATVIAGGEQGLRHGLITLAQLVGAGNAGGVGGVDAAGSEAADLGAVTIADEPIVSFRAVHLDLARRWFEPDVVARLIDLAAWRKLSHVHLHLTDDEGWRFGVDDYPRLAEVAGTRGHGLPIPPLCGTGPAPYGRAYTDEEIAGWVERAAALGITLVPEVDVPGHVHAALVGVPELRDPGDASTAVSVQGYPNNVLVPGLSTTMPFLEAVFGTLARLFPNSPVFHIGGDEVPAGAWAGSPAAQRFAAERGLSTTHQIEAAFHRDVIEMIRTVTGREVAMWEEAAFAGVEPSAYAVAWTSAEAGRRLADLGHRVVMAPGQAYYLDMAPGRGWELPGGSWAGNVTLDDTCAFDPFAGEADDSAGSPDAIGPYGVQACIWGEHIHDLDVLDRLTFPRLDAVAERSWNGEIVGGPADLARRAAGLPRFTSPSPFASESG